jgi:hypothetical protein
LGHFTTYLIFRYTYLKSAHIDPQIIEVIRYGTVGGRRGEEEGEAQGAEGEEAQKNHT